MAQAIQNNFRHYKSVQVLKGLATHPYDLTVEGNLSAQRIERYSASAGEFKLLYGTERINDDVLHALKELAHEAYLADKMAAMQRGEVVNKINGYPSEERMVLHTAMRDFFLHPNEGKEASKAAKMAQAECDKLHDFLKKIDKQNQFTDIVQVGIGGSFLGPAAFSVATQAFAKHNRRAHFISNVDPDDAAAVMRKVDPKSTLVVVVSKSGSTLETVTNESLVRHYFEQAGCNPKEHFIAVTGEKSPMDNPDRYLASFYMWDFVGGRYSVTSMVGAVTLSFAIGYDQFMNVLKGAHEMDRIALNHDLHQNLPMLGALIGIWNRNFLHYSTLAVLPYSNALLRFPAHLQQCDMESNGKRVDREGHPVDFDTGPIVWGEPGTNGQHSFYQLIHQGTNIVPIEFIGFQNSQYGEDLNVEGSTSHEKLLSNLFAQAIALAKGQKSDNPNKIFPGNRPSSILLAKRLDPFTLGSLMAYYEHKIAFQGFCWNINSFDQEGVQLGKVLAQKIIEQFSAKREGKKPAKFPEAEAYLNHLETL
ncbi:MAG: Glucose-6-phosphate isomerase [Chlamydiales bacterium]|nr:Glucose-6-phosphate isomerase [Chlamydiales bacterium]MCH9636029.1 Glucose-6-phosphate isomerase [Chlamydiales bacterium]MCH9703601.1 glucose-6-phosphate isomerase [Chlamydiota bacterium]